MGGNFTYQDAQAMIALVQTAPLANMRAAQQVSELLQRFSAFASFHLQAPEAPANGVLASCNTDGPPS
jgi:hypothetical protein